MAQPGKQLHQLLRQSLPISQPASQSAGSNSGLRLRLNVPTTARSGVIDLGNACEPNVTTLG